MFVILFVSTASKAPFSNLNCVSALSSFSSLSKNEGIDFCFHPAGFFIGFLNGSITSGTGLFVTIWLVVWFGFDYQRAVTYTLILVGLFWNGFGAFTLAMQTEIKWEWIPALIVGALLGGYFGAHLSIAKGSKLVKRCFECVTVAVGVSLIIDGLV